MSKNISEVLKSISDRQHEVASLTEINKPLEIDLGSLTAWDPAGVVLPKEGKAREDYFKELARDNVQVVLNTLGSQSVEGIFKLPESQLKLPRAKPVPTPKPPTKWQKFAQEKGIKSTREKKVWDDVTRKWVPRYGYEKIKNDREKNWLVEVPNSQ